MTIKMKHCEPCFELDGREIEATWKLPQSLDAGQTITFVYACDCHYDDWWGGTDWDGRHLEERIKPQAAH